MYEMLCQNMLIFLILAIYTIFVTFILFYFKRRVQNLETTVKDQAKITQNILGMINTMTMPSSVSKLDNPQEGNLFAEMMGYSPMSGMKTSFFCGKLSDTFGPGSEDKLDPVSFPFKSDLSSASELGGMIVVSDMEDSEESKQDDFQRITDVDDDECVNDLSKEDIHSISVENLGSEPDPKTTTSLCEFATEPNSLECNESDDHKIEEGTCSYDQMKVSELRVLVEKRGIYMSKGKLKKDLIHILQKNDNADLDENEDINKQTMVEEKIFNLDLDLENGGVVNIET